MKLGCLNYLVYIVVIKWLQFETIVICVKLRTMWRYKGFFSILGFFSHKGVQTWFVWLETWHTTLYGIYYCGQMVRIEMDIIENNCHMS